jgi:hypothetical protein
MLKLEIDFFEDTPSAYAHLSFRQEGMRGYRLLLSYLPEFIFALENTEDSEPFYFLYNYCVQHTRSSCTLSVSTIPTPLLHIDSVQKDKLVVHLKERYASWL